MFPFLSLSFCLDIISSLCIRFFFSFHRIYVKIFDASSVVCSKNTIFNLLQLPSYCLVGGNQILVRKFDNSEELPPEKRCIQNHIRNF